jgi:hypothetical protein
MDSEIEKVIALAMLNRFHFIRIRASDAKQGAYQNMCEWVRANLRPLRATIESTNQS